MAKGADHRRTHRTYPSLWTWSIAKLEPVVPQVCGEESRNKGEVHRNATLYILYTDSLDVSTLRRTQRGWTTSLIMVCLEQFTDKHCITHTATYIYTTLHHTHKISCHCIRVTIWHSCQVKERSPPHLCQRLTGIRQGWGPGVSPRLKPHSLFLQEAKEDFASLLSSLGHYGSTQSLMLHHGRYGCQMVHMVDKQLYGGHTISLVVLLSARLSIFMRGLVIFSMSAWLSSILNFHHGRYGCPLKFFFEKRSLWLSSL